MGAFDATPSPAPAPALADDIFGSGLLEPMAAPAPAAPAPAPAAPAAAPPLVETASDDDADVTPTPVAENPTSVATAIEPVDPFAAEGLLSGFSDAPLKTFETSPSKFEYNGSVMAPLKITTAQFGQQWGGCSATSPVSIPSSSKISTLDQFMKESEGIGLHPVEAIGATNEGICAGMVNGGSIVVLIHGKVSGSRLDITVKSTDSTLTGSLALYMQNMMA